MKSVDVGHRRWLVWVVRGVVAIVALVAILAFARFAEAETDAIQTWIASLGYWGPIVFMLLMLLCTSVAVPDTVFGIAAGALFGFWRGAAFATVGILLTAAFTFSLSRRLLRVRIESLLEKSSRAAAIQSTLSSHGLRLLVLLRLSPISPVLVSYAAGASKIRARDFYVGSLALLPSLFFEVYMGYAVAHVGKIASGGEHSWLHTAVILGGLGLCGVSVLYVAKLARAAMNEPVLKEDAALS